MSAVRITGYSTVELMVALVMSAIVAGLAVPALSAVVRSNQIMAANNGFITAIGMARSEAVRRNAFVAVGASRSDGDFARGWQVWVDGNRNGIRDTGEELIHTQGDLGAVSLTGVNPSAVTFNPVGGADSATAATQIFHVCTSEAGSSGREIQINQIGRTSVKQHTCS